MYRCHPCPPPGCAPIPGDGQSQNIDVGAGGSGLPGCGSCVHTGRCPPLCLPAFLHCPIPQTHHSSLRTFALLGSAHKGDTPAAPGPQTLPSANPKGNFFPSLEDSLLSLFFQASQLLLAAPVPISFSRHACQVPSRAQGFCGMSNFCSLTRQLPPMWQ